MKTILFISLFTILIGCISNVVKYPDWYSGTFNGYIGCEHDTLTYNISVNCINTSDTCVISFTDIKVNLLLLTDSITEKSIRFSVLNAAAPLENYKNFILEFNKLDTTEVIYLQALPKIDNSCIHLGQIW